VEKGMLSHVTKDGKAQMVDVSKKIPQLRIAKASGFISLKESTITLIKENNIKKGNVLSVAEIAGIQAGKQTPNLIPLCHPLQITKVDVSAIINMSGIQVETMVSCIGQTGVEMEALTAASVALLTVYDMCKAVDKEMEISNIKLIEKTKTNI
jgi:cyclic pyranopterin phosphate synthase